LIDRLVTANIPFLILGRPHHTDHVSYIDVDNVAAAYEAVSHLIRLGYQRIATITGGTNTTVGLDRKQGYLKALIEQGQSVDETLVVEGDFTEASGYAGMRKLLAAKPDAVFCASDIMAIGAMHAARDAGLRLPDDIAFVGFDDLSLATLPEPRLTTIRQPIYRFGFKAVEILIDLIDHGIQPPRRILMDTEMIIRESCGAKQKMVIE